MGGYVSAPIAVGPDGQSYAAWPVLDPDQVTLARQLSRVEEDLAALRGQLADWVSELSGEVSGGSCDCSDLAA